VNRGPLLNALRKTSGRPREGGRLSLGSLV
jgi:hypothetical protein